MELNPVLRYEEPATNSLSHGMFTSKIKIALNYIQVSARTER